MREADDELSTLREEGLLRHLRELEVDQPPLFRLNGQPVINFSSNDYLGLSHDEELVAAAREATARHGTGSASSRLISGSLSPHRELEEHIAEWKGTESALSFTSGYAAAVGTLQALLNKGDVVILDKLCHASLIDGARQSSATLRVYPHNNLDKLERLLADHRKSLPTDARLLVVTESVFSMDGDRAPLAEIVELTERHEALLLVDEAHATGVFGSTGQGLAEELGLHKRIAFQMGTLGKAVGSAGGYLAAKRHWIDLILNKARSFIYSTAPPPAQAAASSCGIRVISSSRGQNLRERLWAHLSTFSALRSTRAQSAIVPLVFGENESALNASSSLLKAGYLVPAVRFPTVPRGSARLRITLSAIHQEEQVRSLHEHLLALQ